MADREHTYSAVRDLQAGLRPRHEGQSLMSQQNSDLPSVDKAILRQLLPPCGGMNGRDLAAAVGVPGRSIGSRLAALAKRGLVRGERYAGMTTWELTLRGMHEASR